MGQFKRMLQIRLLGLARALTPVFRFGSQTFVFQDAALMPWATVADNGEQYQHDVKLLRSAVDRTDGERIRSFVREQAARVLDAVSGPFDLVDAYTREIPYLLVGEYFGVPGPDRAAFLRWNRSIFWDVFLDLKNEPEIRQNAINSSKEMMPYLMDLITERKADIAAGSAGASPATFRGCTWAPLNL